MAAGNSEAKDFAKDEALQAIAINHSIENGKH
jgi:hypothetical protein